MEKISTVENRILSFAMGGHTTLDQLEHIEVPQILEVCQNHRITGPFLKRLNSEKVFGSELHRAFSKAHQAVVSKYLGEIPKIRATLASVTETTNYVLIKGNSTFLRDGDVFSIKRVQDVDLVFENEGEIQDLLHSLEERSLYKTSRLDMHEVACFSSNGLFFDAHRFCQILTRHADEEGVSVKARPLDYQHLKFELWTSVIEGLPILGPTANAIVIITHAYRDFVKFSSATSRGKPSIRAGDLWDLCCSIHHPAFNKRKFVEYIELFDLAEQVQLFAQLLNYIADDDELFSLADLPKTQTARFPQLVFNCLWRDISDIRDFAAKRDYLKIVHEFAGKRVGTIAALEPISAPLDAMVYYNCNSLYPTDLAAEFSQDGDFLRVSIRPSWPSDVVHRRVHLDVAGELIEWNLRGDEQEPFFKTTGVGRDILSNWETTPEDIHKVELNLANMGTQSTRERLPVVVAVGTFGAHPNITLRAAILPLIVETR